MQHFLRAGTIPNTSLTLLIEWSQQPFRVSNKIVLILQISRVGTERLSNFSTVTQ